LALPPNATTITIPEVLAIFDAQFASVAKGIENGEFALWVGSGISRRAPSLGDLIAKAIEFLRLRTVAAATEATYRPVLVEVLDLAGQDAAVLAARFDAPFDTWPEKDIIVAALWNNYSQVLDVRIPHQPSDYILWEAIDIREAFAAPTLPAAQHLCIAILVLEGAVRSIASGNWDDYIEAALARLSGGTPNIVQVVVDPNHMRNPPGRATLYKFHGCIAHATTEPATFRQYLTGSHTQIIEWPNTPRLAAMRQAVLGVATNQKALVLGLSIQDANLQGIFSQARQVNPWPWPCDPNAPAHVFCEDVIKPGQRDVLRLVYGDAYNDNAAAIYASTHLRAWAEQVLIALVLKLLAEKLAKMMEQALIDSEKGGMTTGLTALLKNLRDAFAALAIADPVEGSRSDITEQGIALWSRLLSLYRMGVLPSRPDAYEVLSHSTPSLIAADQNAIASGLGRLAIGLALFQYGCDQGHWSLSIPTTGDTVAGAFGATGSLTGAGPRPIFLVRSATEAIALESAGGFANDNAVVIHADDVWERMAGSGSGARRVRGAPGRTGRISTLHVSLGAMLSRSTTTDNLQNEFLSEVIL
jgi:hypothetical protein